jgi:hypothetical protein
VGVEVGVGVGVGVWVEVGVGLGAGQTWRNGLHLLEPLGAANTPDPRTNAAMTTDETKPMRAYTREREVAMMNPPGRPLHARPAHALAPLLPIPPQSARHRAKRMVRTDGFP